MDAYDRPKNNGIYDTLKQTSSYGVPKGCLSKIPPTVRSDWDKMMNDYYLEDIQPKLVHPSVLATKGWNTYNRYL